MRFAHSIQVRNILECSRDSIVALYGVSLAPSRILKNITYRLVTFTTVLALPDLAPRATAPIALLRFCS